MPTSGFHRLTEILPAARLLSGVAFSCSTFAPECGYWTVGADRGPSHSGWRKLSRPARQLGLTSNVVRLKPPPHWRLKAELATFASNSPVFTNSRSPILHSTLPTLSPCSSTCESHFRR